MSGRLALVAVCLVALAACDAQEPPAAPLDHAVVRVQNLTGVDVSSVTVELKVLERGVLERGVEQERTYGPLPDGATSPYLRFEGDHEYTLTLVTVREPLSRTLTAQRDDDDIYDPFLGPGRYTYRIMGEYYDAPHLAGRSFRPDGPADAIEVRVENQTDTAFDALSVRYPGPSRGAAKEVAYGALAPGEASAYVAIPHSYPYAPFVAVADGDTTRYPVFDYHGVEPVAPGRYTYPIYEQDAVAFRDETVLIRDGDF